MTPEEKGAIPVSVVALRADAYDRNGNIVITLRTKFSSAERKYSVPIECFHDLIVDLQRLNASAGSKPNEASPELEEMPIAAE